MVTAALAVMLSKTELSTALFQILSSQIFIPLFSKYGVFHRHDHDMFESWYIMVMLIYCSDNCHILRSINNLVYKTTILNSFAKLSAIKERWKVICSSDFLFAQNGYVTWFWLVEEASNISNFERCWMYAENSDII